MSKPDILQEKPIKLEEKNKSSEDICIKGRNIEALDLIIKPVLAKNGSIDLNQQVNSSNIEDLVGLIEQSTNIETRQLAMQTLSEKLVSHKNLSDGTTSKVVEKIYKNIISPFVEEVEKENETCRLTKLFSTSMAVVHRMARVCETQKQQRVLFQPDLIEDVINYIKLHLLSKKENNKGESCLVECVGFLTALASKMRPAIRKLQEKNFSSILSGEAVVIRKKKQKSSQSSFLSALRTKSFSKPVDEGLDLLKDCKLTSLCWELLNYDVTSKRRDKLTAHVVGLLAALTEGDETWSHVHRITMAREEVMRKLAGLLGRDRSEEVVARTVRLVSNLNKSVVNQPLITTFLMRDLVGILLMGDNFRESPRCILQTLRTLAELLSNAINRNENVREFAGCCGVHVVMFLSTKNRKVDDEGVRKAAHDLLRVTWKNSRELLAGFGYLRPVHEVSQHDPKRVSFDSTFST